MDVLDYAEAQGRRNADFSLQTLELLSRRAHALLVLLLGGAGAAGGVALARLDVAGAALVVAGLGVVSVWWFALAAMLAFGALPTRDVRAPAGVGWVLLQHARGPLADYAKQAAVERAAAGLADGGDVLALLRESELRVLQETAAQYRDASTAVARVLDRVYRAAALTPLLVGVALALVRWLA